MTEKVKVPKWFDEWYKSFEKSWRGNDDARLYYISRMGFGFFLEDGENNEMNMECVEYVEKNKEKLIRAILDGYEVEEEYIEVSPIKAYEGYFNNREVFHKRKYDSKYYSVNVRDFIPADIKDYNIKFYIKKENE